MYKFLKNHNFIGVLVGVLVVAGVIIGVQGSKLNTTTAQVQEMNEQIAQVNGSLAALSVKARDSGFSSAIKNIRNKSLNPTLQKSDNNDQTERAMDKTTTNSPTAQDVSNDESVQRYDHERSVDKRRNVKESDSFTPVSLPATQTNDDLGVMYQCKNEDNDDIEYMDVSNESNSFTYSGPSGTWNCTAVAASTLDKVKAGIISNYIETSIVKNNFDKEPSSYDAINPGGDIDYVPYKCTHSSGGSGIFDFEFSGDNPSSFTASSSNGTWKCTKVSSSS